MTSFLLVLALLQSGVIDTTRTPGVANPDITQANIGENICAPRGTWSTKSIRPPSSYTTALKKIQMRELGFTVPNTMRRFDVRQCVERSNNPQCYEEDHAISLELGGHPRDPQNLSPQAYTGPWGAQKKDALENTLHRLVCDGTLTLAEAQQAIAVDWVAAYQHYVKGHP